MKNQKDSLRGLEPTQAGEPTPVAAPDMLRCLDCDRLYSEFGLDVHLPRSQWLMIHDSEHGVICAQCIVNRAAKIPGVTVAHMVLEVSPCVSERWELATQIRELTARLEVQRAMRRDEAQSLPKGTE